MGRRPSATSLASLSITALQQEIRRRQRSVGPLQKRRAKLVAKLEAIDAEIAALGGMSGGMGKGGGVRGTRPKNELNLVDALAGVLKGKTMGVSEAADAVQKAGYKSHAANFRTIVNATLLKHRNKFKKVARGQYTAA